MTTIQNLCRQKSLRIEDLAVASGIEYRRVESIYNGQWTPSPTEREKIAVTLGKSSPEIAWGHSTPVEHLYGPN